MKKLLISLPLFMFVLPCFCQQVIELNNWKFKTGDNLEWVKLGFDDSAWNPIKVGQNWEPQGYTDYNGYAWYRIKFKLPSDIKKSVFADSLQFLLGKIDDCDQTFLNGKLLGQNGRSVSGGTIPQQDISKLKSAWNIARSYTLPVNDQRLLWDKENILVVRVYDSGNGGGLCSLPNINVKDLNDYLIFNTGLNISKAKSDGTVSKTITIKNLSPLPEIKGKLFVEVANHNQVIASQTYPVDLKRDEAAFTINFKGDLAKQTKATYTFTESKTGTKVVRTWESECTGGWVKYEHNPVLGGDLGTIFDISVLKSNEGIYRMYCSWRDKKSIALSESKDGLTWTLPVVCLSFDDNSTWEKELNRPVVIQKDGMYHMWYTGQANNCSWIGYAVSEDGKNWTRKSDKPVLSPDAPWEKVAVMCPHVIWDEQEQTFKMWYSGGEQYEPDAIGYATSKDGLKWEKYKSNPIFSNNKTNEWEQAKVTACQIIKQSDGYLMLYIGFKNIDYAQIGMARSKDGITLWERFKENPIIKPGPGWDASAVYKPYAVPDAKNNQWLLYYNGRRETHEQIGIAIHKGLELEF